MKSQVWLLHLIHNLCQLIRDQSHQEHLPAPQQVENPRQDEMLMRAGINENLKQLMDTHNLNLPPALTFPQFTTEVIGETNDLEHLCSILQDLYMGLVVITFIKPTIFSIFFLQGQGVVSQTLGRGDKVR